MIEFIKVHKIHPVIDRMYRLGQAADAFTRMKQGQQFGNIGFVFDE